MARVLISVPRSAARGEVITIRTLIQHPMESGYRPDAAGDLQPRDILRRFTCTYDDAVVFAATLSPAIAANPLLAFSTVATRSGLIVLSWEGDNGFRQTETRHLDVT